MGLVQIGWGTYLTTRFPDAYFEIQTALTDAQGDIVPPFFFTLTIFDRMITSLQTRTTDGTFKADSLAFEGDNYNLYSLEHVYVKDIESSSRVDVFPQLVE